MKARIKSLARRVLPQRTIENVRHITLSLPRTLERHRTERIFANAAASPAYLDSEKLHKLQELYRAPADYGYDAVAVERRGIERATQLLRLPGADSSKTYLEIGCWDGMVSTALQRRGKSTVAIDNRSDGFDQRAQAAGVRLVQMDAACLSFEGASFDFVFSYDAFEHVASPEDVLREAIRVVKPGGHIYLEFGPLYYSPFGEHAYRSITVPYCQFLFEPAVLNRYATERGLDPIDFDHVNRWTLDGYRALWSKHANAIKPVHYQERTDLAHLDLIRAHPSCFKSKSTSFEEFTVSSVFALFQRQ